MRGNLRGIEAAEIEAEGNHGDAVPQARNGTQQFARGEIGKHGDLIGAFERRALTLAQPFDARGILIESQHQLHAGFRRRGARDQQQIEAMGVENLDFAVGDQFGKALRRAEAAERCTAAELDLDRLDAVALQLMSRGGGVIGDGGAAADVVQRGGELDRHPRLAALVESAQQMQYGRGARRPLGRAAAAVSSGFGGAVD